MEALLPPAWGHTLNKQPALLLPLTPASRHTATDLRNLSSSTSLFSQKWREGIRVGSS